LTLSIQFAARFKQESSTVLRQEGIAARLRETGLRGATDVLETGCPIVVEFGKVDNGEEKMLDDGVTLKLVVGKVEELALAADDDEVAARDELTTLSVAKG
jgi:hypothetical protein